MEKKSSQKVKTFLKKNVYYIIMAACLIAIAAMITVTVLMNNGTENGKISENGDSKTVDITDPEQPTGGDITDTPTGGDDTPTGGDDTPTGGDDTPTGGDEPTTEPIVFGLPVDAVDIIKDYAPDTLVWNSTLRHYAVHNGIDFGGEDGANVRCVCDGVISAVGYDMLNGYTVTVKHNDKLYSSYGSLNEPTVKVGQSVKKGDVIGTMGTSASNEYSSGPHLHFSVYENDAPTDPYRYMTIGGK